MIRLLSHFELTITERGYFRQQNQPASNAGRTNHPPGLAKPDCVYRYLETPKSPGILETLYPSSTSCSLATDDTIPLPASSWRHGKYGGFGPLCPLPHKGQCRANREPQVLLSLRSCPRAPWMAVGQGNWRRQTEPWRWPLPQTRYPFGCIRQFPQGLARRGSSIALASVLASNGLRLSAHALLWPKLRMSQQSPHGLPRPVRLEPQQEGDPLPTSSDQPLHALKPPRFCPSRWRCERVRLPARR